MKSIIKRVIVGVLIALTLSFIKSCDVKALSKQMTYSSASLYNQNNAVTTNKETADVNGVAYWNFYTSTALPLYSPALQMVGVTPSDGTTNIFGNYDYFSFIVYGNPVQPSAAVLNALDIACTPYYAGNNAINSAGGLMENYTFFECNLSNVTNLSSTGMVIYYNTNTTTQFQLGTRVQRKFYFYNDPIGQDLQDIFTALNTANSVLNTISSRTLNIYNLLNTNIPNIITELQTNNTKLQSILERVRFIDNHLQDSATQQHNDSVNEQAKQQETTNAVKDMDNTIKDSNVDNPTDYSSNVANNGVITQLITLPISLYTKILNSTSSSCSPFSLGTLYETELIIPCINLSNYLGSTLYNVIDILISGLFIYAISRKMVKVFNSLSSMKEGDVING